MKRKSFLLIASVFAMSLGLVACGGTPAVSSEASSVASETSVASVTSSVSSAVDYTAITITNKEALQATWYAGEANRTVELSGTPEFNPTALIMSGELKVTSSNPAMVQVNGLVLTALDAGSVSITVRLGNVMDTVTITVNPVIALVKKTATVPELIEAVKAMDQTTTVIDNKTLYTVTGYAADIQNNSYGDFNLYSEDYASSIIVYGSSTTSSCLTISKTAGIDSEVSFKNPGDFVYGTTVHEGDKVTMSVVLEGYKGKPEILGWIDSSKTIATTENKTITASVTVDDATHGTAVLSKTEGIYVGEELTLTCTPATDYKVDTVKLNGKAITADAADANKFVFNAYHVNVLTVTYASTAVVLQDIAVPAVNLAASKAVGDAITLTGMQVFKATETKTGAVVLASKDGFAYVYVGSSPAAGSFEATLAAASVGDVLDVAGAVAKYTKNGFDLIQVATLTACAANTTVAKGNLKFAAAATSVGSFATADDASATMAAMLANTTGLLGSVQTITATYFSTGTGKVYCAAVAGSGYKYTNPLATSYTFMLSFQDPSNVFADFLSTTVDKTKQFDISFIAYQVSAVATASQSGNGTIYVVPVAFSAHTA